MPHSFSKAIWVCPPASLRGINTYYEYKAVFSLARTERNVIACIAAHTDYAITLDGDLIGLGQFADYADSPIYDTLSLPNLAQGQHEIIITVYHSGISTSRVRNRPSSLIFQLTSARGEPIVWSAPGIPVRKHPAYHSGPMEMVSGQLGYTFAYDARHESDAIPFCPADDAEISILPIPRPIEKLTVSSPLPAELIASGHFLSGKGSLGERIYTADLSAAAPGDGIWLRYDLGQETTGILSLDITLPSDAEILIGWGEHLTDARVRTAIGGRNFALSYFGHAGRNTFSAPFLRLGLRYYEVLICAPSAEIHHIGILETVYPLARRANFRCSSERHNRIYDVSLHTLHLCMHEHYEDCPWREQALYTMDSRNQMLCGYYAFGETRFPRASIELMAHSLREDHMLELCSPAEVSITIPSFTAIFLTQLAEYLTYSGDRDFVLRMLPTAKEIADGFLSRIDRETGLLPTYPEQRYWNFYEWQDGLSGDISGSISAEDMTYDAPLCAFVAIGLSSLSKILYSFERNEDARFYEKSTQLLCDAIDRVFWDETRRCYASFCRLPDHSLFHYAELTNALIVYANAAPDDRADAVCRLLAADNSSLLPITLSHSIFKYEALLRHGGYHAYVFRRIESVFGKMLDAGATTFWETEMGDADFGNAGSLCHGWSAIPAYLYLRYACNPTEDTGLTECRSF